MEVLTEVEGKNVLFLFKLGLSTTNSTLVTDNSGCKEGKTTGPTVESCLRVGTGAAILLSSLVEKAKVLVSVIILVVGVTSTGCNPAAGDQGLIVDGKLKGFEGSR